MAVQIVRIRPLRNRLNVSLESIIVHGIPNIPCSRLQIMLWKMTLLFSGVRTLQETTFSYIGALNRTLEISRKAGEN